MLTYADTFRTQDVNLTRNQLKVLRAKARRAGLYATVTGPVLVGGTTFTDLLVVADVAA